MTERTREAPYGLRMPDDLKEKIKQAAARECRSMNAEIVRHLRAIYLPEEQQEQD